MAVYQLRSKSAALRVRDGKGLSAPMREVGPTDWVWFQHLPEGLPVRGDADIDVREYDEAPAGTFDPPAVLEEKAPELAAEVAEAVAPVEEPVVAAEPEVADEPELAAEPEPDPEPKKRGRPRKGW